MLIHIPVCGRLFSSIASEWILCAIPATFLELGKLLRPVYECQPKSCRRLLHFVPHLISYQFCKGPFLPTFTLRISDTNSLFPVYMRMFCDVRTFRCELGRISSHAKCEIRMRDLLRYIHVLGVHDETKSWRPCRA